MDHKFSGKLLKDLLGREWTLGRQIGHGGFSTVFETDRECVVKLFKTKKSYETETFAFLNLCTKDKIERYKQKRGLGHLGCPKLFGHGHSDILGTKMWFMVVQKLFPIKDLFNGAYRENNMIMMTVQVLDVLEFFHENGWTHNDVKYDNIMIDSMRNYYLIDYGLMSTFIGAKEQPSEIPFLGTVSHMSIDVHRGYVNPPRGDVTSLSFMLKLILTCPWDIAKHQLSNMTATLIEKESFSENPECGNFTQFAKAVFRIDYLEKPNYTLLKQQLPKNNTTAALQKLFETKCRLKQTYWMFSSIIQTQLLPYFYRLNRKIATIYRLISNHKAKIEIQDLINIIDTDDKLVIEDSLKNYLSQFCKDYTDVLTEDSKYLIVNCIVTWINHVSKTTNDVYGQLVSEGSIATVGIVANRVTHILSMARP